MVLNFPRQCKAGPGWIRFDTGPGPDYDGLVSHNPPPPLPVICVLAGRSERMGSPKQHVQIGGRTFLGHLLACLAVVGGRLGPRLFVGREGDAASQRQVVAAGGDWLVNPDPERGPLSTLRIGLDHLPSRSGFLFWPIDHPLVSPETVLTVCQTAVDHPEALVVPSFEHRRGHPVVFPAWAVADLRAAPLEGGARQVFQHHPDRVIHVPVPDRWVRANLDTPADLAAAAALLDASGCEQERPR